nr:MAG TPA: Cation-transporting ATPase [Caudoviricetes sp.]
MRNADPRGYFFCCKFCETCYTIIKSRQRYSDREG